MANVKISALPAVTTVVPGSDVLPLVSGGITTKATPNQVVQAVLPAPGPIGGTTANTGAFTTLSASSTVSGTGFSNYLASPPAIGATAAAAGTFTNLTYTGTLTGSTGVLAIGTNQIYKDASGNVGIGTSSPSSFSGYTTVSVNNATNGGIYNILVNGTETARLQAYSGIFNVAAKGAATVLTFETNGSERMRLDSSGNLGLGVTPQSGAYSSSKFIQLGATGIVEGRSGVEVVQFGSNWYLNSGATGYNYITSASASRYSQVSGAHYWYNAPSGTAGNAITFTQAMTLDASGNLLVGQTTASYTTLGASVRANGAVSSASASDFWNAYSTAAGAYRFYVTNVGTVYATNTTISAISDQRLKENIRDLDDGLASILALKPRKFDWKEGKGKDIKNDRGFIAQEFEQVFPDMIDTWKDPAPEGEEPYKAVNANLIPTLVKAIQELSAELNELKAKVNA